MKIIVTGFYINKPGTAPYARITELIKSISFPEINVKNEIYFLPLNKCIKGPRIILFYPLYFIISFYCAYKSIRKELNNPVEPLVVYFYGRNLTLLLALYYCVRNNRSVRIIADHVEHPFYLYSYKSFLSNLKLDQIFGFPFLWYLADINLYISKQFQQSFFFNSAKSIYFPILIPKNTNHSIYCVSEFGQLINFETISSLASRDRPDLLIKLVKIAAHDSRVHIHLIGRFKNNKLLNELKSFANVSIYPDASELVKQNILSICDYFILFRNHRKSEYYSSPTRLAEFVSYNKPILVNNSIVIVNVFGKNSNGFYEFNTKEDISSILSNLSTVSTCDLNYYNRTIEHSLSKFKEAIS
jgi:hypothetical protein